MKFFLAVITFIFIGLTILGVFYVLLNYGTANAGYSVVPMVLALAFGSWYRKVK